MKGEERGTAAFARAITALAPYLEDLVFIGGWAHYLHTLHPEATPPRFEPLMTLDLDVAAPLRLPERATPIDTLLTHAGFTRRLRGNHRPPIAEYVLEEDGSGFYLEFLAPLVGGEVKKGKLDVTTKVGGVTAQTLRHLDILLDAPWRVRLSRRDGFPLAKPLTVQVPNPAAYVVQKILVLGKRAPADVPKDVLYVHDTFTVFADALPVLRRAWDELRVGPAQRRKFQKQVASLTGKVTDPIRGAARIAASRQGAPSPEVVLGGLRRGFADGFGFAPP